MSSMSIDPNIEGKLNRGLVSGAPQSGNDIRGYLSIKTTDRIAMEIFAQVAMTLAKTLQVSTKLSKFPRYHEKEYVFYADIAERGINSVKTEIAVKSTQADTSESPFLMPTKEQLKSAAYKPFQPGKSTQDETEVSLDDLDDFSASREMGSGTANTVFMYRTTIEGKEYFVKRVRITIAESALAIQRLAQYLELGPHILPSVHVEDPKDPDYAFLLTPMIAETKDVDTQTLISNLGSDTANREFMTKIALFDHIIANTDRSNIKQLMADDKGNVYLVDNDDSLQQSSLPFESRTGGAHIVELYAEEMGISHKSLEISKEMISAAEEMNKNLNPFVQEFTDTNFRNTVIYNLKQGLAGICALKGLEKPTLGDLCEMSETMDRLQGTST